MKGGGWAPLSGSWEGGGAAEAVGLGGMWDWGGVGGSRMRK